MSTIVSARPMRDLKAEVAAIKRISGRFISFGDKAIAKRIFQQDFFADVNVNDARIARNGGRSFLSIYSVVRRYRAQQNKAAV